MMLHRHFEAEKNKNVTTLEDVTPKPKQDEFVSEIFPPEEPTKRRGGRPKKTDESKE